MKPNEAIPNINEHNKTNFVFSRICLVPCISGGLFDDGEMHCRVYDPCLSQIYQQTMTWKWTGPLKKYCNIDILTLILMHNKLKWTSHYCTHLMLQKKEIGKKTWWISSDSPNFFTTRVFNCTVFIGCMSLLLVTIQYFTELNWGLGRSEKSFELIFAFQDGFSMCYNNTIVNLQDNP